MSWVVCSHRLVGANTPIVPHPHKVCLQLKTRSGSIQERPRRVLRQGAQSCPVAEDLAPQKKITSTRVLKRNFSVAVVAVTCESIKWSLWPGATRWKTFEPIVNQCDSNTQAREEINALCCILLSRPTVRFFVRLARRAHLPEERPLDRKA